MPASMDSPSPKRLRSDSEPESADKDRISSLPEDVMGFILSLLTSKEAQETSLLSRRWRHVPTSQVIDLDFDWSHLLDEMEANPELAEKEKARFVEWVDNALPRQNGGYYIRRFRTCFDLNISYQSHIDRWIKFALAKRVKVLQLDFESLYDTYWTDWMSDCDPSPWPYMLRREILGDTDVVGCSKQASCPRSFDSRPSGSWHVGLRYLEQLTLNRVAVEGELIEQLLANCPVLERLDLRRTRILFSDYCGWNIFRVSGRSLMLKHLVIEWCDNLDRIEIYDMDLVSFTFVGNYIQICLDKLPQLSEVCVLGFVLPPLKAIFAQLSSLPCLRILKFEFYDRLKENLVIDQLPKLTSVKELKLGVREAEGDASLLPLTRLIDACPCLRSLELKMLMVTDVRCSPKEVKKIERPRHRNLKEVEFHNYRPSDLDLVLYLVENVINLEKLVVTPCDKEYVSSERKTVKISKETTRERALEQLKGKIPSKIELVIN